ncbi:hypothetical protein NC653_032492 [Populus alba x Populus x berolinensis]|uniref:Uncharacterized protein n=1 Tax=Populus alba x Populus x berolinensis TaxID=444605 RepID=A0AAD6LSQ1_9ROSI|nr:hypothetical protein NC653_032492 [Populus alba x Populus x berolinensis]
MKSSAVKIDLEKSWDFFIALSTNKDCPDNRRGRRSLLVALAAQFEATRASKKIRKKMQTED